jgi:hypothetical protein
MDLLSRMLGREDTDDTRAIKIAVVISIPLRASESGIARERGS